LTLVSAPAGFGKTTLLAEWLSGTTGEDRSVAWLSLDPAVPGVGSSALELVASSPLSTELVLTSVLNELAAAPVGIWLVLDDYHLVDSHEIGTGMSFLLEHLPPQVHVVISTRADPDLPLSRWRVRGELIEIRAADLRFTADEAAAYLNEAAALNLAAEDVAALEARTEGWIAALQLAALSIQGRDDVGAFIARFTGNDRYVVDYLVEEVLQHQPDQVRGFLLQSAVLDRLTAPLCDAVTGWPSSLIRFRCCRDDGSQMLLSLERGNLFLVPLDDRREHLRASRWYERLGLPDDAVRHALAARDFDCAAHLMELAVPTIRRKPAGRDAARLAEGTA
jgi:LuxR family maltose regulon positive regulatory protein